MGIAEPGEAGGWFTEGSLLRRSVKGGLLSFNINVTVLGQQQDRGKKKTTGHFMHSITLIEQSQNYLLEFGRRSLLMHLL
jgi:hypothetical protein